MELLRHRATLPASRAEDNAGSSNAINRAMIEMTTNSSISVKTRVAFGRPIADQTVTQERIAEARIMIDQNRLLTLYTAHKMDQYGNKEARKEIAMIKVAAPNMACQVVDWAIQAHGGAGLSDDFGLGHAYATARLLRLADGPDEVHRNQIARLELKQY